MFFGGVSISGAGCIANDLWDRRFDTKVTRTKERPLAKGVIKTSTALGLLFLMLLLSFLVVLLIPIESRSTCLKLAFAALPLILIYPSAKRWFNFPQVLLAICWGFSVLIPWAAIEGSLSSDLSLLCCWLATIVWTFGFDTVYAMADIEDDNKLALKSSAITLGKNAKNVVSICYGATSLLMAISAFNSEINSIFWPFLITASYGMQKEVSNLKKKSIDLKSSTFGIHFRNQVYLGSLILLGLVFSNLVN